MKTLSLILSALCLVTTLGAQDFTYFIRQIQMPDNTEYDVSVEQEGTRLSELEINPEGARFELWTIKSDPLTSYLLDSTYVNSYIPVAEVEIVSEDPYEVIPRTRCDRPFTVNIMVDGLSSDPEAPEAAKSVKLLRHVQAYHSEGTGKNTDRGNATLLSEGSLDSNGTHTLSYPVTSIPGGDRTKVRGEERFSVYSLEDEQAPESQLDAQFMQVWPMATSSLSGIASGDVIKELVPEVTVVLDDLYPDSWTYVQVYPGSPALGTQGVVVPGASILVDGSVPRDETIELAGWDESVPTDGPWTLEVLTVTPFGIDRLAYTSFQVERAIRVNGGVTSVD
ncbi:MAG: hypothetical protein WD342_09775 [Verrucomicrobiales bacterium]